MGLKLKRSLFIALTALNRGTSETLLLYPFLLGIFVYVFMYGLYLTDGFRDTDFNLLFLIVFIPIFFIDALKILVECNSPANFSKSAEETDKVTIIIPTMNGGDTLEKTLVNLLQKFAPQNIIVASNGSTDNTCDIARQYGVRLLDIPKPIGKIDAINTALPFVKTEYCMTMDDDVLIKSATIPTGLLKESTGVAFRVMPIKTNWVTELQMHEYRKSMDVGKNFHNITKTVQNISGAIGLFHTKELLRQRELHTGEFSGEDLQRTLLIHLNEKNKGAILSQSIVLTDVPNTIVSLFKQRVFGWGPGLLNNLGNLFKLIFKKNVPFRLRYEAFYNIFLVIVMDPIRLIALPIIVYYPELALIVYLTYVAMEAVPYFKLKAKEPVWVLFAMPIYGLFMFIARITGTLVFLYRRTAVFISQKPRRDDYRTVSLTSRITSLALASIIFFVSVAFIAISTKPIIRNEAETFEFVFTVDKTMNPETKGIWMWHSPTTMSFETMESELAFLETEGFTTVYIDITDYIDIYESGDTLSETAFTMRLKAFTEIAAEKNIKVEALVGGTIWADPNYNYVPEILLRYVIAFNEKPEHTIKITGIQFDVETYNQPEFTTLANQRRLLTDYLTMVQNLTTIVETESPELKLGFAVPFWFDNETRNLPQVAFNGTNQPTGFHVLDTINTIQNGYIVIMDYRNKTGGKNGSIKLATPQLNYANENTPNVKVIIAQETTNVQPANITFFGKPESALDKALDELTEAFRENDAFAGFAIHDSEGYRILTRERP